MKISSSTILQILKFALSLSQKSLRVSQINDLIVLVTMKINQKARGFVPEPFVF